MNESSKMRYVVAVLLAFGLFIFVNIQNQFDWIVFPALTGNTTLSVASVSTSVKAYQYAKFASFLLSAFLVLRFDSTKMLSIGIAGSSIVNLIIPVTATSSEILFVLICVCKGVFEAMIFPYFVTIMSYWAPVKENSTLVAISLFGYLFGQVISSSIGISLSGTNIGVPFYVFGALGICWTVLWLTFVIEKPSEHPKVSQSELQNITADEKEGELITTLTRAHYKGMFRRKSTFAIIFLAIAMVYNIYATVFIQLGFIVASENEDSRLAYTSIFSKLTATFSVVIVGVATDYFRRNFSITKIRKLIICIALLSSAVLLPFIGILRTQSVSVHLMQNGLYIILQGIILHGYLVNALDVVYRAAGYVIGITFGVADVLSRIIIMITTLVIAVNLPADQMSNLDNYFRFENQTPIIWTGLILNIIACVVYALCGSAKRENVTTNFVRAENLISYSNTA